MKISVVRTEDYRINEVPKDIILNRQSDHVPGVGDVIKVGHTLNGFKALNVDRRVFRSKIGTEDDGNAFQEVILLVSDAQ